MVGRFAPLAELIAPADDEFIAFLREWATRKFDEGGEHQEALAILPETILALLKRLDVLDAAMKMGAAVH